MKLSFSLSSSKPPKPALNSSKDVSSSSSAQKEFVTEFDPSKTLADLSRNPKVIAPIPNEWRPQKKMRNIDLPVKSDDPNLQFEVDPNSTAEPTDSNITYGLNLRAKKGSDPDSEPKPERFQSSSSIDNLIQQKVRNDLARLPDDRGIDEFQDMSVDDFAAALLKGYGWSEGRGIGRNAKEDVKVYEYKKRTGKEGLGFANDTPQPPMNGNNNRVAPPINGNNNRVAPPINGNNNIGSPPSNGNNIRVAKTKKEGVSNGERKRFYVGTDVRVVGGDETGLKGRIMEVIAGGESVVLRLSRTEEEVIVRVGDVADLGSLEEEKCLKNLKDIGGHEVRTNRRSKDLSASRRRESSSKRTRERDEMSANSLIYWLNSSIRVRIISKELKGGRLYLQKGEVVDVVGPTTCDISMDKSGELIQGIEQDFLETALPRRGGPVLVLYGRHKGVYGSLEEKDVDKETAVVRDADTHALINVRLDQIAEYVGNPDDIGY